MTDAPDAVRGDEPHRLSVVVASGTFADAAVEQETLGDRGTARLASLATPEDVRRETAGADGVIVTVNPLTAAHIGALGEHVRIIGRCGIGLDAIDLDAAGTRGIAVLHTPDYATNEVATHAAAMILAVHRKLISADQLARTRWTDWTSLGEIKPIEDSTVGLVGCGRIGRAVLRRLAPFAGRLLVYDPAPGELPAPAQRAASLRELLAESDIVSLHLPLTVDTRQLIGAEALSWMRRGAMLVNVSRGALIDELALVDALRAGTLGATALDVLATEPPPAEAPILHAPNVLLSPHFAWYSRESGRRARTQTTQGMVEFLGGSAPTVGRLAAGVPSGRA